MDEFDKIRELSEDISNRKEPVFTGFGGSREPTFAPMGESEKLYQQPVSSELETASSVSSAGQNEVPNPYPERQSVYSLERQNQTPIDEKPYKAHYEPRVLTDPLNTEGDSAFHPEKVGVYTSHMDEMVLEEEISFEPIETEVEEKTLPNMRFHLFFMGILVVALVCSLVGFYIFYKEGDDFDEIATITASQEMVKEMPDQAGGMSIPDQDKLVYNRIRTDSVATKVESLFPEPERPVIPQILAIEQNAPEAEFVGMDKVEAVDPLKEAPATISVQAPSQIPMPKPQPVPAFQEEVKVIPTPKMQPKPMPVTVVEAEAIPFEKPKLPPVVIENEDEPTLSKPKKEVITLTPSALHKAVVQEQPVQEGIWRVQLFASNNKDAVEKAWRRIERQHSRLLSNMSYLIKKVDIKGKGAFYRLQVGQFPTREMADGLCTKLKAKRQDCIPTK